jgi:hypothetical protein
VEGIPCLVLLDGQGVIRFKLTGLPEDGEGLDEAVAQLLEELKVHGDPKKAVRTEKKQRKSLDD